MSEYQMVQKSALKLKGVSDQAVSIKKHKKKKKSKDKEKVKESLAPTTTKETSGDGEEGQASTSATTTRQQEIEKLYRNKTKAELAFLRRKEELDKERIKKKGSVSHKERVEQFNTYLESLSEHYEQAKVSWTK